MKISVTKQFQFSAAHHLPGYDGACADMHGHTYILEVTVTGEIDLDSGMVADFHRISEVTEHLVIDWHDHTDLAKMYDNPTAEVMARSIFRAIAEHWVDMGYDGEITKIKLWENPLHGSGSWVEVEVD